MRYEQLETKISLAKSCIIILLNIEYIKVFLIKSVLSLSLPSSGSYSESSSQSFIKFTPKSFAKTCGLGMDKSIDGTGSGERIKGW